MQDNNKQLHRILDSFAKGVSPTVSDEAVKQITSMSVTGIRLIIDIERAVGYQKGKKEGFEDLARMIENFTSEFVDSPQQALASIKEWIEACRHSEEVDNG